VKSERHSCERQTATTQLQGISSFLFVFPFKYIYQTQNKHSILCLCYCRFKPRTLTQLRRSLISFLLNLSESFFYLIIPFTGSIKIVFFFCCCILRVFPVNRSSSFLGYDDYYYYYYFNVFLFGYREDLRNFNSEGF